MTIGSFSTLDHLTVTVVTVDGAEGRGEATVIPEFMHESRDEMLSQVELLSVALAGADPAAIEEIHERIDRVAPRSHSVRAAIDEACHDVAAKASDIPVWKLLGARERESITCTWVIGLKSVEETVKEALAKREAGFEVFKLKVGEDDEEDVVKLARLRDALGARATIRLDANGAYSANRALQALDKLARYDIEMVEQPCEAGDLAAMANVRRKLGLKVLADESVFSVGDAIHLIEAAAADFVNVKVQKVGGLHRAHQVADEIERAGLACVVGSCLECGPGVAASAHFAVTCASARFASDLCAGIQMISACDAHVLGGIGPVIHEPHTAGLGFTGCA